MLTAHASRRSLWGIVSVCLLAGRVLWGCAPPEPRPPQPSPADVSQRLAAMAECVTRAQGALNTAAAAGTSAADLAPANSRMADLRGALDEATNLAQQDKLQEAADRATQGLAECGEIATMVEQAPQNAAERTMRAQMANEAETRLEWTVTCVDGARQAIGSASTAGVKTVDLTAALSALDGAETALQQGRALLAQSDSKGAIERLETAQADCQTARDATDQATAAKRKSARPRRR